MTEIEITKTETLEELNEYLKVLKHQRRYYIRIVEQVEYDIREIERTIQNIP